jgi:hypothetical protein
MRMFRRTVMFVLNIVALLTVEPSSRQMLRSAIPASAQASSVVATDLQARTECSNTQLRKGIAKLSWKIASNVGSAQRVDVTIYRDGFETGKFETIGPLPPGQSSLVWERLDPGIIHYYRVLTLHTQEWVPSETASFEGPTCVADFQPRPGP